MKNSHGPIILRQRENPSISNFTKSDTSSNQFFHTKLNFSSITQFFASLWLIEYSYGVQLRHPTLKHFNPSGQSACASINNAPWYVSNFCLHTDLQIPNIYTLASHFYKLFHKNSLNHFLIPLYSIPPLLPFLIIHHAVLSAIGPGTSSALKKKSRIVK